MTLIATQISHATAMAISVQYLDELDALLTHWLVSGAVRGTAYYDTAVSRDTVRAAIWEKQNILRRTYDRPA